MAEHAAERQSSRRDPGAAILSAFTLDPRGLAAMRIGFGLIILVDVFLRSRFLVAHYTDAGILPRSAALALADRPLISLLMLNGDAWLPGLLLVVLAAAAVGLLIGYRTRLMTAVCWLLLLSMDARNPFLADRGDLILILLLLWSMLLPLGAVWSVDARRRSDAAGPILSTATMGFVLQLCLIYLISVLHKYGAPWREDFTAVWYALQIDSLTTPLGVALAQAPMPLLQGLTISTLVLEAAGPFLVLVTAWRGRLRTAVVLAFIGLHVGLASTFYLGVFPFVCIAAWTALLPAPFWDRVGASLRPAIPATIQLGRIGSSLAIFLMMASGLAAIHGIAPNTLSKALGPAWTNTQAGIRAVGIYQEWTMFAPRPATQDTWYSFTGVGIDGSRRNVLFERTWPDFSSDNPYAKPSLVRAAYPDGKWEKYLFQYYGTEDFELHREHLAAYLWDRWHRLHPDVPLERIDVERFLEETPRPGDTAQIERQLLLTYRSPDLGVAATR